MRPVVVDWRSDLAAASFLDATTRVVGFVLAEFMARDGVGSPSRATLAGNAGTSVDTVDRAIRRLELAGLLIVRRDGGRMRTNTYRAVVKGRTRAAVSDVVKGRTDAAVTTFEKAANGPVKGRTRAARTREDQKEPGAHARDASARARGNGTERFVPDDVLIAAKNAEAERLLGVKFTDEGQTP